MPRRREQHKALSSNLQPAELERVCLKQMEKAVGQLNPRARTLKQYVCSKGMFVGRSAQATSREAALLTICKNSQMLSAGRCACYEMLKYHYSRENALRSAGNRENIEDQKVAWWVRMLPRLATSHSIVLKPEAPRAPEPEPEAASTPEPEAEAASAPEPEAAPAPIPVPSRKATPRGARPLA